MPRPIVMGSLGELYANELQAEDAGDGNVRLVFSRTRGNACLETVSVIMPSTRYQTALAHLLEDHQFPLANQIARRHHQ